MQMEATASTRKTCGWFKLPAYNRQVHICISPVLFSTPGTICCDLCSECDPHTSKPPPTPPLIAAAFVSDNLCGMLIIPAGWLSECGLYEFRFQERDPRDPCDLLLDWVIEMLQIGTLLAFFIMPEHERFSNEWVNENSRIVEMS